MDYPGCLSELDDSSFAGSEVQSDHFWIFGKLQLEARNLFTFDIREVGAPHLSPESALRANNYAGLRTRELLDGLTDQGLGEKVTTGFRLRDLRDHWKPPLSNYATETLPPVIKLGNCPVSFCGVV